MEFITKGISKEDFQRISSKQMEFVKTVLYQRVDFDKADADFKKLLPSSEGLIRPFEYFNDSKTHGSRYVYTDRFAFRNNEDVFTVECLYRSFPGGFDRDIVVSWSSSQTIKNRVSAGYGESTHPSSSNEYHFVAQLIIKLMLGCPPEQTFQEFVDLEKSLKSWNGLLF